MSAVETRLLRHGRSGVFTADDQFVVTDGPNIYGVVYRKGLRAYWRIISTRGVVVPLAKGRAWTKRRAWDRAYAAAHRPGITDEVTR